MNKEEVRRLLNNQSSKLFDDIVNSRVLGANNHIRMIGEIMLLTDEDESENGKSVLYKVREIARFFMETRGQQSRAIYNAICYYIKGLDDLENAEEREIREHIANRIKAYGAEAAKDMDTLISYGVHIAENLDTIMIFDYSSTVDRFVAELRRKRTIYIPDRKSVV